VRGAAERVRLMTIHAAKGLEAPVVFLADAAAVPQDRKAHEALVDWPAGADRPRLIQLLPKSGDLDRRTAAMVDAARAIGQREDANLLYVALTRARQMLIVSASSRAKGDGGWYERIREAIDPESGTGSIPGRYLEDGVWVHEAGDAPPAGATSAQPRPPEPVPRGLSAPLTCVAPELEIAPSRSAGEILGNAHDNTGGDEDARLRGIAIHRLLEWLASGHDGSDEVLGRRLAAELRLDPAHPELADWLAEARSVLAAPALAAVFAPRADSCDYCEVPLQYTAPDGRTVYGIIDRLRVGPDRILLVDYKTHRVADEDHARRVAEVYREPMALYAEGVRRVWPGREVESRLLFTHLRALV
jgi:ATP-dependent helicase/nuclease subunit A